MSEKSSKGYPPLIQDIKNTCWIFVSASHEERHIYDIVWAVQCLLARGVKKDNVYIFADFPFTKSTLGFFDLENRYFHIHDMDNVIPKITNVEAAQITITGHGSQEGVVSHTGQKFHPQYFFNIIRKIKDIKFGIILVCQCFGGIFDFMNANDKPEIVAFGASKLFLSFSNPLPLVLDKVGLVKQYKDPPANPAEAESRAKLIRWNVNVFMYYYFKWIRNPIDTDGDGTANIIDGYKYAGSCAHHALVLSKKITFLESATEELKKKLQDHISGAHPLTEDQFSAADKLYSDRAEVLFSHQEPWILHANFARSISFQ